MNSRAYYSPIVVHEKTGPVSVGERPEAQFFLGDLPQARKAQRLDHQEKDDERAEQDQGQVGHQPCRKSEAERSMKIGRSTMKAAPRNDPRMLPTPPTMIMKRILKESSSSNPAGSTVPRYANA